MSFLSAHRQMALPLDFFLPSSSNGSESDEAPQGRVRIEAGRGRRAALSALRVRRVHVVQLAHEVPELPRRVRRRVGVGLVNVVSFRCSYTQTKGR